MSAMFQLPKPLILDTTGELASTWTLRFFVAGTTTPKTVYSDAALSIAINQPIGVSSTGVFPRIFIGTGAYKVGLYTDTSGTTFASGYPVDDCDTGIPAGSGALPVANGGTAATTAAGARTNLAAASQADLNTQAAALAVIQAAITALPGSALGDIAGLDLLTRAYLAVGFGSIVIQRSEVANSTAQSTTASIIPLDNTIPQITEGGEVLSGSFTPVSATSTFEVRVDLMVSTSNNISVCVALFQDTTANALAARWQKVPAADDLVNVSFIHRMSSVSVAATTFRVRIGSAGSTTAINGTTAARVGGGVVRSSITVTEYLAF